ncbi:MAG TPA: EF-P lysine aminoacylase EpmA [Pseudomonadales bacterium]|nr:EF-P lysine aminoacylase EpmA [Pseudomonadales bacterium]
MKPDWHPSVSLENIARRAEALAAVRNFFAARHVLEVDVPVMARSTITDPNIETFLVSSPCSSTEKYYLTSSPEFFMKRLLVAGSGPIYYMGHAFRVEEKGSRHNPEFTIIEWYRPEWTTAQLMQELAELVAKLLPCEMLRYTTYRQIFLDYLGVDPHQAGLAQLKVMGRERLSPAFDSDDRNIWLDFLFSHLIEPQLQGMVFVEQFPASQAALAKTFRDDYGNAVAARFELYVDGLELANGYEEEQDASVLSQRFESDRKLRKERGQPVPDTDRTFLAAMQEGLPACAGVALGFDRLLMLSLRARHISEVISFAE